MKKQTKIIVVVLGIVLLIGASIFFVPKLFSTDSSPRTVTPVAQTKILNTAKFVEIDAVHKGYGTVTLEKDFNGTQLYLKFAKDFKVAEGPDLYIWLVKKQSLGAALGGVNTNTSEYIELGKLNKTSGEQTFSVSQAEFDSNSYAVVIWCKAFGVQFTHAIWES